MGGITKHALYLQALRFFLSKYCVMCDHVKTILFGMNRLNVHVGFFNHIPNLIVSIINGLKPQMERKALALL